MGNYTHLREVESYLKQLKISDRELECDFLLNSLEDSKFEILILLDYQQAPEWLVKRILNSLKKTGKAEADDEDKAKNLIKIEQIYIRNSS